MKNKTSEQKRVHTVRRVLSLVQGMQGKELALCLLCLVTAGLTILEPVILSDLVNAASSSALSGKMYLILLAILVFLARAGLSFLKKSRVLKLRNEYVRRICDALTSHILHEKISEFQKVTPAYHMSRVLDEVSNIDGVLPCYLLDGGISLLICLVLFGLALYENWLVGLLIILFVIADYYISFRLPMTKVYKRYSEVSARTKSELTNTLEGTVLIKMGESYEREETRSDHKLKEFLEAGYQKNYFTQMMRLSGTMCRQFGYILTIVVSAFMMYRQRMSVGQFTFVLTLYNLIWSNAVSAENMIPLYKYGKATCDRICEILDTETETAEVVGTTTEERTGTTKSEMKAETASLQTLDCQNLEFSYDDTRTILNGVSLKANRGEVISLAGYSGCGKSTVLDLLLGFYDRDGGVVSMNGREVSTADLVALRPRIGYVGQNDFMFNRPVLENVLYYVEDTPQNREKMNRYLEELELTAIIDALPNGINTVMGENSADVSGGEKQRLCIVRELMKDPELLILDEFTSHLDPKSEETVLKMIRRLAPNMMVIQAAHRVTALSMSDRIYVLENGRNVCEGTHEELLKNSEYYQNFLSSIEAEK